MLSIEEDERLKAVGPGTPMGKLLRRYWHPVAATSQLDAKPVMAVKLLGEDLVLYRDGGSRLGLLAQACAHRRSSLAFGIPEARGLRCAYHGWLYDNRGQCIDQPSEPEGSKFEDKIKTTAYPVEELGGLVFAYLGPAPAPLLPRYNVLVWNHSSRETNGTVIKCNWLQVLENMLDPVHVEHLHGRFFSHILDQTDSEEAARFRARFAPAQMKRVGFDLFENGIIERHMTDSETERSWTLGSAVFFPAMAMLGAADKSGSLIYVVPQDDTHTWFLLHMARPARGAAQEASSPFYDVPGVDEAGEFMLGTANGQDNMAVSTQGAMTRRDLEHLGSSDMGIIMYRQLLLDQLTLLEDGGEPMNVLRTRAGNHRIDLPIPDAQASDRHEVLIR
jgi:5,5'-dehydrodivanillate O-demethylase